MNAPATPLIRSLQASLQASNDTAREAAFADFLRVGLPTQRLDAWKYTDLRRLAAREFAIANEPSASVDAAKLLSVPCTQRIVFVDGVFAAELSTLADASSLITRATPRSAASESRVATLRPSTLNAFELLNSALRIDAVELRMNSTSSIPPTTYVAYVWSNAATGLMKHPRLSVRIADNTSANLIEHHLGLNTAANFSNLMIDIAVGKNAELLHTRIQEDVAANFLIENIRVDISTQARYRSHQYVLGAGLSRCDIDVQLSGIESHAELHGLLLAQNSEHVDVRTCMDHRSPNTRSLEDYRGIANGRGRVVFNGKVIVRPDAQKTDARQSSRNLLLSPTAEIDARPELEIYANDVQCAHGATVGQLDANALFYLQSRGLSADDSRALLTHAFAAELLERLPDAELREYILGRLMQRLGSRAPQL